MATMSFGHMDGVQLVGQLRKHDCRVSKVFNLCDRTKDTEMLTACVDIGVDLICRKPVLKKILHQLPVMQHFT